MAKVNLEKMSLEELKQLSKDVSAAIKDFEARKRREALAAVEAKAKEMGFSLSELTGGSGGKAKSPSVPKYRHPENPSLTWTGRGRKPGWFVDAVNGGTNPDDLLIK